MKLATDAFATAAKATDPYYQKTLSDANRAGWGAGQGGSGQLRTSIGDAAHNRELELDTSRDTLTQKAIEGSIEDAKTAYQQELASAGLGLTSDLGHGNLDLAKAGLTGTIDGEKTLGAKAQDTDEKVALGGLGVQQGALDLAKTTQAASAGQAQQQIDLQAKRDAIAAKVADGSLTIAQANQQLAELKNAQEFGLAGETLDLAKKGQTASIDQNQQKLDLDKKTADINAAYQAGTLSLAQRNQQLAELTASNQNTLATGALDLAKKTQASSDENAKAALAEQVAGRLQQGSQFDASLAQSGDQFKQTIAQNAKQFGLSQIQQMALAKLGDATQNRQIDASTAQGRLQVLTQLAGIMAGADGTINPQTLANLAGMFGIATNLGAQSSVKPAAKLVPPPQAPPPRAQAPMSGGRYTDEGPARELDLADPSRMEF